MSRTFTEDIEARPEGGKEPDPRPASKSSLRESPHSAKSLQHSGPQRAIVLDAMAELVTYLDTHLRIQWVNRAAAESVQMSREQLIGRHCFNIWQKRETACAGCPVMKARHTGQPQESEMASVDGRVWHVRGYPVHDAEGRVVGMVEVTLDITERKRAEQALKKSEERYKELVESINDVIYATDRQGILTYVSPSVERIHGYGPQELVGRSMTAIVHSDDLPLAKKTLEQVAGADQATVELRIIAKGGVVKWILVSGKPVFQDGHFMGVRGILSDITARKVMEGRIERISQLKVELLKRRRLDEKMKIITDSVVKIFDADFARIWIIKPGDLCDAGCYHAGAETGPHVCRHRDRCLALVASSGRYTHIDGEIHQRVPFGCYQIGRIAAGQDAKFITNDVASNPQVHDHAWASKLGLVSFAGYRLLAESGEPMGVLALFSKHAVTPEEDALLEDLANSTSQVIQTTRAEEELQRSEEKFRRLFETTLEAIGASGPDGRIVSANPAMARVLGLSDPEQLIGIPAVQLYANPDDREAFLEELRSAGSVENFELTLVKQDDRKTPVHILGNATLHTDEEGNILRTDFIFSDITERKRAERALRASEEKYRTLNENINVGLYRNTPGPEGRFIEANPAIVKMFGYGSKEEFMNVSVSDLYQDANRRQLFNGKMAASGFVKNEEIKLRRKDGTSFWGAVTAVAIRDQNGKIQYYDGVIEDITERRRAQEALRESEGKFRILADQSPNMIFINKRGKIVYVNHQCEQIMGYTREEFFSPDFDFRDLLTPESQDVVMASFEKRMQGIEVPPHEYSLVTKEGRKIHALLSSKLIDYEGEQAILSTVTDISERKRAEEELRRSEEKYRELYENLRDGSAAVDMDGKIVEFNSAFRQMLGYSEEEIYRLTYEDITPMKWHLLEAKIIRDQVMTRGYSDVYEKEYIRRDGSVFPVEIQTYLIRDKVGQPISMWAIVRDITERKRVEEKKRISEERYRTIFETSPEAILLLDKNGLMISANDRLADWLGYERNEIVGRNVLELPFIPGPGKAILREKFSQRMSGKPVSPYQVDFISKDGHRRVGRMHGALLRDKEGRMIGDLVMVSDVTAQKKAEEERQRSLEKLQDLIEGVVKTISVTVETRDQYTAGHQKRVAILASAIAQEMNLPEEKIKAIYMAALIHDIGKISIPAEILSKPARLSEVEYSIIKTHPQVGYDILKGIEFPWPIAEIILKHHERIDGSGYPQGLKGGEIPMEARILSVADVVEAMASHRPYRPALGIGKALEEITQNKGKFYDSEVVKSCLRVFYDRKFEWQEDS